MNLADADSVIGGAWRPVNTSTRLNIGSLMTVYIMADAMRRASAKAVKRSSSWKPPL